MVINNPNMQNLKKAVKRLVSAGVVITPDAFRALKNSSNPLKITLIFLKNTKKDEIDETDIFQIEKKLFLETTNSTKLNIDPVESTSNDEVKKIIHSIPRRIPRRIPRKNFNTKVKHNIQNENKALNSIKNKNIQNIDKDIKTTEYQTFIRTKFEDLSGIHNFEPQLSVIKNPQLTGEFIGTVDDLLSYFQDRYRKLSQIFRGRIDIPNIIPISEIRGREKLLSIIGMVIDKNITAESAKIYLDDPSSEKEIEVIIPRKNPSLIEISNQILDDSVICISGFMNRGKMIANDIQLPDIPLHRKQNRAENPIHVAFLSDIHIGSKEFLSKPMDNLIKFLNGELGNTKVQKVGLQTKYVLFGGDVVDGVGIYPNQHDDLSIDSIEDQYDAFANFIDQIPSDTQIVIIPGNHDMTRSAEPQPQIDPKYIPQLNNMSNVHMLANPSQIDIHGVKILLYHCTSMPDIMNHIPGAPQDKPEEIMRYMLKARHLAPIWGTKTPIAAEAEDHLVIDQVPDIFHGGHIHINGEGYYRGVQIVNSGTMQSQTSFQKSLNIIPTPGRLTVTNLKDFSINHINLLNP